MRRLGHATKFRQYRNGTTKQLSDFDHAWQIMFAYTGPGMVMREVALGAIPGKYPGFGVRQVVIDKQSEGRALAADGMNADRCVLCQLQFGIEYNDPGLGLQVIQRNRRNRFYCNICDMFIRSCPGQAILELPCLVVDVKHSRQIRNREDIGLQKYPRMLAAFHRRVAAIIQKNMGFVLNTVGDAVIGVWPSGFIPESLRQKHNWDVNNPAKVSAMFAIQAAQDLSRDAPRDPHGDRLPYRGALDTTGMAIFSVQSDTSISPFEFGDLDTEEVGIPLIDQLGNTLLAQAKVPGDGSESEIQTGPAATDIAGEAVEVASELSSHTHVKAGDFLVTKRTDLIAEQDITTFKYTDNILDGIFVRKVLDS